MSKHFLFFTLCMVACFPLRAATEGRDTLHPDGVAELKWTMTAADAKKIMLGKAGVTLESETPESLHFTGGTFANTPCESWELNFRDEKFHSAVILLKPAELWPTYKELRKSLNEKYRKPGREEGREGVHQATYWNYAEGNRSWAIACDVSANGIRLSYWYKPPPAQQSPQSPLATPSPKGPTKKDL
jgi:hypothetical protein